MFLDCLFLIKVSIYLVFFLAKIKSLWEELSDFQPPHSCTCEGFKPLLDYLHSEHVMSFLMGPDDNYSQISGQILLMNLLPSISRVFSLVVQEEKRQELGTLSQPPSSVAFAVPPPSPKPPQSGSTKRERPKCSHCKMLGHTESKCYKKHDYPAAYKKSTSVVNQVTASNDNLTSDGPMQLTQAQYDQLLTLLQRQVALAASSQQPNSTSSSTPGKLTFSFFKNLAFTTYPNNDNSSIWIVNSGATTHITCSLDNNICFSHLNNQFVYLPTRNVVEVKAIGSVKLNNHITLHKVLFILDFKVNLLSVSSLTKFNGTKISFYHSSFAI